MPKRAQYARFGKKVPQVRNTDPFEAVYRTVVLVLRAHLIQDTLRENQGAILCACIYIWSKNSGTPKFYVPLGPKLRYADPKLDNVTTVVLENLLPNCAYCARLGVSTFHWFLSARNLSLNFFGTDCAQVFNFTSCPNVRNTHGSVGNTGRTLRENQTELVCKYCGKPGGNLRGNPYLMCNLNQNYGRIDPSARKI
eukprot:COSAG02_NODE_26_length_51927_cov_61.213881_47_plen_196_part_00